MKFSLRILLPLVALAVALGVGGVLLTRPFPPRTPTNTPGTNSGTNATTNSALNEEPVGVALNANATVGTVNLTFVKAYRAPDFLTTKAALGSEFIVATFQPLSGNATKLETEARTFRLVSGDRSFSPPNFIRLTNAKDSTANGAIVFEVPTGLTGLRLVLNGSKEVALPLE